MSDLKDEFLKDIRTDRYRRALFDQVGLKAQPRLTVDLLLIQLDKQIQRKGYVQVVTKLIFL